MISIDQIKKYYPVSMAENAVFQKHILKEYVQLLTLDYLSTTEHIRKMSFIGGTNLRLAKGIDRSGSIRSSAVCHEDCRHARQRKRA